MSNSQVGNIYKLVIDEVVEGSRVDFEDSGLDAALLDQLKEIWQQKLSSLNVAKLPWDPPDEPSPAQIANPPTLPSNVGRPNPSPQPPKSSGPSASGAPTSYDAYGEPEIKHEPDTSQPNHFQPGQATSSNPQLASSRAAQLIHERFGAHATQTVNNMQSGLMMPGQQRQGLQLPGKPSIPQMMQQMPQQGQHDAPNGSANGTIKQQTDGPGDDDASSQWSAIMTQRNEAGEETRTTVELDNKLQEYIRQRGRAMDDGGLMVSLEEYNSHRRAKKRKLAPLAASASDPSAPTPTAPTTNSQPSSTSPFKPRQFHGPDDSDMDADGDDFDSDDDPTATTSATVPQAIKPEPKPPRDEDAITSDLDDSEDDFDADADDDEAMPFMMLCMYEKVQRVKNKWKCTLKDGVLTVNGREYVFNRSTGEYDW